MNKKKMPALFLVIGLIMGIVAGWLLFGNGFSNSGDAKKVINNYYEPTVNPTSCSPVPHLCAGANPTCYTSSCVSQVGKLWWDCSNCNYGWH